MIKITKQILEKIIKHAKQRAPIEACGYLAGWGKVASYHYEMTNVDKSSEHFSFEPQQQFSVLRDARARGIKILAVYHSHPQSPARPSAEDIRLAYDPSLYYVIVSLAEKQPEVAAFSIRQGEVQEEGIEII